MNIRPVSDLRNKFAEIETIVSGGDPVYLTKNGYGTMVVLSIEQFEALSNPLELAMDEADRAAVRDSRRLSHDEVFNALRRGLHEEV